MHRDWRITFTGSQSKLLEIFERETNAADVLASDLKDEVDRIEALCLLQYETTDHSDKYSEDQLALLKSCQEMRSNFALMAITQHLSGSFHHMDLRRDPANQE